MNRKLCIDGAEMSVIATSPNGEIKVACWGQTSATARPLPTRDKIAGAIADGWNSVTTLNATAQSIGPSAASDAVLALLKGTEQ